jgi:hypothetical protein
MRYFIRNASQLIIFLLLQSIIVGQKPYTIPAFCGYAIPLEKSNEEEQSILFSEKEGLNNWENKNQQIHYHFYLQSTGLLRLALYIKNEKPGNELRVRMADKNFRVIVPKSNQVKKVIVGSVNITRPGFYVVELHATKKNGKKIADLRSLELSGPASKNVLFNARPRRNAASVHLLYPLADTTKAIGFYNEVTIPKNADQLYSYFMACGFARGYFGMQVNSASERRVIFSVWDAGDEAVSRDKVYEGNRVLLKGKGENVIAEGFGNEGTGAHSHFVYNWRPGETYQMYVTALPDSASGTTVYTGYFFIPELQKWKLIASFKAPKDGKYLHGLYSFVENFWGCNGNLYRRANFANQWIKNENEEWKELTESKFSCDATGKTGDRIDFGGGTENNSFYLWNGGFQNANAKYGDVFTRAATNKKPVIDLYKNADSLLQAERDKKQIFDSIRSGKLDTTGSFNGVYYKIMKEGEGDFVQVNDTLTVNYKGWLINGEVFADSKDRSATFVLNRLIKGWQFGLTKCKKTGSI